MENVACYTDQDITRAALLPIGCSPAAAQRAPASDSKLNYQPAGGKLDE